jgi:hypothetical protein
VKNSLVRISVLAVSCAAFACGDSSSTIVRFEASSMEVDPYNTVELIWEVRGTRVLDISTTDGTLVSTFEPSGTVTSSPLRKTTKFVLTARFGSSQVTRELEVHVRWAMPTITQFIASPNPSFLNSFTNLQWGTRNAEEVRVFRGDALVATMRAQNDVFQSLNVLITEESTVFRLVASNPELSASVELTVTAEIPPEVQRFVAFPRTVVGSTATATVAWRARGITSTTLMLNGSQVQSFPGTLTGTVTIEVRNDYNELLLNGFKDGNLVTQAFRQIARPTTEQEPNDTRDFAKDLTFPGGVTAELSSASDVDFHLIFVSFNFDLRLMTVDPLGGGCATDTLIILHGSDGRELGSSSGGGGPAPGGGECAVIDPAIHPFASDLLETVYYIEVKGENGAFGPYALLTDEL